MHQLSTWLRTDEFLGVCRRLVRTPVSCPGHAREKGNEWAERLAGKATVTSGLLLGRSGVLRSLRHYLTNGQRAGQTDRCTQRCTHHDWLSIQGAGKVDAKDVALLSLLVGLNLAKVILSTEENSTSPSNSPYFRFGVFSNLWLFSAWWSLTN